MEKTCTSLNREVEILERLLVRNRSQHRRAGYYRALEAVAAAARRLNPAALPAFLADGAVVASRPAAWRALACACAELVAALRTATGRLSEQLAAGYFMAIMVAWLACTSRLLVCLRAVVARLLNVGRSLAAGANELPPAHARVVEWVMALGAEGGGGGGGTTKARKATKQAAATDRDDTSSARTGAVSTGELDEDLGEQIAFAPTTAAVRRSDEDDLGLSVSRGGGGGGGAGARSSTWADADDGQPSLTKSIALATEYSDSESDGGSDAEQGGTPNRRGGAPGIANSDAPGRGPKEEPAPLFFIDNARPEPTPADPHDAAPAGTSREAHGRGAWPGGPKQKKSKGSRDKGGPEASGSWNSKGKFVVGGAEEDNELTLSFSKAGSFVADGGGGMASKKPKAKGKVKGKLNGKLKGKGGVKPKTKSVGKTPADRAPSPLSRKRKESEGGGGSAGGATKKKRPKKVGGGGGAGGGQGDDIDDIFGDL